MTTRPATSYQLTLATFPGDWPDAACVSSQYVDAFHPGDDENFRVKDATEYAKGVCKTCPRRLACLQWALEAGLTATYGGIYGGTTWDERRKMRSTS